MAAKTFSNKLFFQSKGGRSRRPFSLRPGAPADRTMRIVKDICAGCPLLIHGTCRWEPGDPCKITDMSARFRETAVAVRALADSMKRIQWPELATEESTH